MAPTTATAATAEVTLREVEPDDADACARICFEAFGGIDDHHRFPRDFPTLEAAAGLMSMWIPHPSIWGVVAERDGEIVGSNFLDERDPIRGVGPITVDPKAQGGGVGPSLMRAVLDRGEGAAGIRLVQGAYNMRSLSIYTLLGFDLREPLAVIGGEPRGEPLAGVEVRPLEEDDLDRCESLCERGHGFTRTNELRDAIRAFQPFVAVRDGRVTAYASSPTFWPMNHGVAETDEDMQALLLGMPSQLEDPLAFLVPLRWGLFRWCLDQGLRLMKPTNLMSLGEYREPRGSWYPSVLY